MDAQKERKSFIDDLPPRDLARTQQKGGGGGGLVHQSIPCIPHQTKEGWGKEGG